MTTQHLVLADHIVSLVIYGLPWIVVVVSLIGFFKE